MTIGQLIDEIIRQKNSGVVLDSVRFHNKGHCSGYIGSGTGAVSLRFRWAVSAQKAAEKDLPLYWEEMTSLDAINLSQVPVQEYVGLMLAGIRKSFENRKTP